MSKKEDWTKRRKAKQIAVGRSSKPTTRPMVVVVEHPKRERERPEAAVSKCSFESLKEPAA